MNNKEALRCLLCKRPRCTEACPAHTAVPECMQLYREDRLDEAGEILFANNPLSAITAQVCAWRDYCYGHCVLNVKKIAVRWYEIEQEVSARYLETVSLRRGGPGLRTFTPDARLPLSGRRIALAGAGPVGIAAAVWLYEAGADVTLMDANPRIGGVLRYGIPPFRLDKRFVDAYERIFADAGIRFIGGMVVGRDISLRSLSAQNDAVILAPGAGKSLKLGIPGEDHPSVMGALPYLKHPEAFDLGRKVIVIGGGNVAMDTCRTAVRSGAEVHVFYRKTFANMPANPFEVEEAQREGVHFSLFEAPVEVRPGRDGYRCTVVFRECENTTDPETGKTVTRILDGTDHEVPCDSLLLAISERPSLGLFGDMVPVINRWGYPDVDAEQRILFKGPDGTDASAAPTNIYTAGDFLLGPKTVVHAVATARTAVEAIIQSLRP